jgi:pimeloyl-ACP methyl ester carboxylesterase
VAGARWRRYEAGCLLDPVPVVLLPDLGVGGLSHAGALESAGRFGRRAIAIDLPGSGGSSQARAGWRVGRIARGLGELLDALRLRQIDLVAMGLGGVVARSFASIFPGRVRSLVTLDSPIRRLDPESARRLETARRRPRELAGLLASGLPQSLPEEVRRALVELLLAVGPSRLARPFRWLRVEDLGRGERGLARRSAPSRSTPWKALYSSPEHPGFAEANELAGVEARLVGDLASSEVLWSVLEEMSGLAGHDHGGSGTAPAHDRNVG